MTAYANGYGRLSDMQGQLTGVAATQLIDELLSFRDEASREFDKRSLRKAGFYTTTATKLFSGDGSRHLLLGRDLLSVTTLKVASSQAEADAGTFDYTLVAGTDYRLWPLNAAAEGFPYRAVDLLDDAQVGGWLYGEGTVQIAGKWGYSEEWEDSGLTGTVATDSGLTVTANSTAASIIDPGDMLKIEDEQLGHVASISTVSVVIAAGGRGANGTTAATHSAKSIYIRRYPRDIERVVKERAVGLAWDSQGGYRTAAMMAGEGTDRRESFGRWKSAIRSYRDPSGVV